MNSILLLWLWEVATISLIGDVPSGFSNAGGRPRASRGNPPLAAGRDAESAVAAIPRADIPLCLHVMCVVSELASIF